MSFEWLLETLRAHPHFIPAIMFVVTLGEAVVFTSPLVPATVLCFGIAALHHVAGGAFASIVIAATLGTLIGDVISYAVGRRYHASIGTWAPFNKNPTWLPRAIAFMQKWGVLGLVGSKFLGPVRWFGPAVCGILQMRFVPFFIVTVGASILWSVIVLGPPYYGAKAAG